MPTAASAALRAAIHNALVADAPLSALLGGPRVYDEPPKSVAFPYVTLGRDARRRFLDRHRAGRGASPDTACLVAPGRPQGGAPRCRRAVAGARRCAAHAYRPPPGQFPLRARRRAA